MNNWDVLIVELFTMTLGRWGKIKVMRVKPSPKIIEGGLDQIIQKIYLRDEKKKE